MIKERKKRKEKEPPPNFVNDFQKTIPPNCSPPKKKERKRGNQKSTQHDPAALFLAHGEEGIGAFYFRP